MDPIRCSATVETAEDVKKVIEALRALELKRDNMVLRKVTNHFHKSLLSARKPGFPFPFIEATMLFRHHDIAMLGEIQIHVKKTLDLKKRAKILLKILKLAI